MTDTAIMYCAALMACGPDAPRSVADANQWCRDMAQLGARYRDDRHPPLFGWLDAELGAP